jgi:hypothetical protein
MYRGTIHMAAPAAGARSPVKLIVCRRATAGEDYGCLELSADEKPITAFARYTVALVEFEILHTRARDTDTIYAALQGRVANNDRQTRMLVLFKVRRPSAFLGRSKAIIKTELSPSRMFRSVPLILSRRLMLISHLHMSW